MIPFRPVIIQDFHWDFPKKKLFLYLRLVSSEKDSDTYTYRIPNPVISYLEIDFSEEPLFQTLKEPEHLKQLPKNFMLYPVSRLCAEYDAMTTVYDKTLQRRTVVYHTFTLCVNTDMVLNYPKLSASLFRQLVDEMQWTCSAQQKEEHFLENLFQT